MGDGDGTRGKVEAGEGGEPAGDAGPDGKGDLTVGGGKYGQTAGDIMEGALWISVLRSWASAYRSDSLN